MGTRVCLGGTFNVIHAGHEALLARACSEGDEIFVGLTSDAMAAKDRKVSVVPYAERLRNLAEAAGRVCPGKGIAIHEINDEMGPAATGDFDVIVVSEETVPGAERINRARAASGLKPLRVTVVGMVLGPDGERLSSTRSIEGDNS